MQDEFENDYENFWDICGECDQPNQRCECPEEEGENDE